MDEEEYEIEEVDHIEGGTEAGGGAVQEAFTDAVVENAVEQLENGSAIHPMGVIPDFEGAPVETLIVKVKGLTKLDVDMPVFTIDDRVRLVSEFICVDVRHYTDPKTGNIIREQIITPQRVETCPFDVNNPDDVGVLRAQEIES